MLIQEDRFLNLYIYHDSLAFRRLDQSQDIGFLYPFVLKAMIEENLGLRVNLLLRGQAGGGIRKILEIIKRDVEYFQGDNEVINIAILQCGIVDCAPRPRTYPLMKILKYIPIVGPKIIEKMVKHRRVFQLLFGSYAYTSQRAFRKMYNLIVQLCYGAKLRPIAVGMPLPTLAIEYRSPGFRKNATLYNRLMLDVIPEDFCDIESAMTEPLREKFLLADGHHLTEMGHLLYAEKLFDRLKKSL